MTENNTLEAYKEVQEYVPLELTPFNSYTMDIGLSKEAKFNLIISTNACSKEGYRDLTDIKEYASILKVHTGTPVNDALKLMPGKKGIIELSNTTVDYLKKAEGNSLIVTHNHNNNSEFSKNDLRLFLKYPSIKIITAAADGQLFYLEKVDGVVYDVNEVLEGLKDLPKTAEVLLKQYNIKLMSEEQYTDFKFALLTDYYKKKNLVFRRW